MEGINPQMMAMMATMMQMMQGASAAAPRQELVATSFSAEGITLTKGMRSDNTPYSLIAIEVSDDMTASERTHTVRRFNREGLWNILAKYPTLTLGDDPADPTKPIHVDLAALMASPDYNNPKIKNLLVWKGGVVKTYAFRKGLCYANEANNAAARRKNKNGQFITASECSVFCQQIMAPDGTIQYAEGMDPESQGREIEDTYFMVAATQTADVTATETLTPPPATIGAPAPQPAPQPAPAPAPAPTAAPTAPVVTA